jgi:hypothetical protein
MKAGGMLIWRDYYDAGEVNQLLHQVRRVLTYHIGKHEISLKQGTTIDWGPAKKLLDEVKEIVP